MIGHLVRHAEAQHRDHLLLGFDTFLREQQERVRAQLSIFEAQRLIRDGDGPYLGPRDHDVIEVRR